jgi:hypothetical protein
MVNRGPHTFQSNYAIDINKYTLEGNNKTINAHIFTMRSNRTSILRIDPEDRDAKEEVKMESIDMKRKLCLVCSSVLSLMYFVE